MQNQSFEAASWLNRPGTSSVAADRLTVVTDPNTDFWRDTYYGYARDTGHALLVEQPGRFTAELRVEARYQRLYDQAGLMVRIDDRRWLKTGVELTDGKLYLSTVVTDARSDWSVTAMDGDLTDVRLRVTIDAGSVRVQASTDGATWPLLRLAPFPQSDRYGVGPMAATPEGAGLRVVFSGFRCGPASTKDLHDLS